MEINIYIYFHSYQICVRIIENLNQPKNPQIFSENMNSLGNIMEQNLEVGKTMNYGHNSNLPDIQDCFWFDQRDFR